MSGNQFDWDDEEQDFRDIPDEVSEKHAPPAAIPSARRPLVSEQMSKQPEVFQPPAIQYDDEPQYDEGHENYEEPVEDYSAVLSDARLRLEQGRLYEMIMNHNLFEGVDADARAIKNVQNEIRTFAKERMEVMLGMRPEPTVTIDGVALPFNSLEVEVLRSLASTATKGATKSPDVEQYVAPAVEARRSGLAPIGSGRPRLSPPRQESRPLPSRPQAPVRRQRPDPNLEKLEARLRADGVEQEFIEEAKRQLATENYKPLDKHVHEMGADELKERNRQAALRTGQQVKSPTALPMATPEQMEAMAIQRANQAASHPSMIRIMDLLNRPQRK